MCVGMINDADSSFPAHKYFFCFLWTLDINLSMKCHLKMKKRKYFTKTWAYLTAFLFLLLQFHTFLFVQILVLFQLVSQMLHFVLQGVEHSSSRRRRHGCCFCLYFLQNSTNLNSETFLFVIPKSVVWNSPFSVLSRLPVVKTRKQFCLWDGGVVSVTVYSSLWCLNAEVPHNITGSCLTDIK